MTRACAVYARVSTDMQGESLENQVEYAKEYIRRLGDDFRLDESCIYTDFDQSGYYTRFLQRPAIQSALQAAKEHKYDVIVFKEISRISRDQAEHVEIVSRFSQYGVRIIAINDNLDSDRPETLDLLGIHSVMSEMESKRISSRVSTGKKSLARRGYWIGEAPIGYQLNAETRQLEVDPTFQHVPSLIFKLFTQERMGTFKIADYLNQNGILTKNGRLWSRVTVNRVLTNPAYVGDLVYGRTRNTLKRIFDENGYSKVKGRNRIAKEDWIIVPATHQALVTRETFRNAERIMSTRAKQNPRRSKHPLTGILKCGRCGDGMVCQKQRYNGKEYRYYTCSRAFRFGRSVCNQQNLKASDVEQGIWTFLLQNLIRYGPTNVSLELKRRAQGGQRARQKSLKRDLNKARLGLERLLMETDLPQSTYTRLKETYIQTIQSLEAELNQKPVEEQRDRQIEQMVLKVHNFVDELRKTSMDDLIELRRIFHSLIHQITVDGTKITAIHFKYNLD